ncbi:hypothetical protein [Caballeronia sp. INML2]|nr:hypothetical protein [Caballeronia sp. INML2]
MTSIRRWLLGWLICGLGVAHDAHDARRDAAPGDIAMDYVQIG